MNNKTKCTTFSDVFERTNYLFVSFEPGAFGHTVGRVLCTLPQVHWYSNSDNGVHPWNVSHTSIRERKVASRHFNRVMPNGVMLPPTHDYVEDFVPCWHEYYTKHFAPQYLLADAQSFDCYLLFCNHSLPMDLLEIFPNSKIINIVGDVASTVERYLNTSAKFPGHLKHQWMNGTQTEHGQFLQELADKLGKNFTVQDVWENRNTGDFVKYTKERISNNMEKRRCINDSRVLTVTKKDYNLMKNFIGDLDDRRK